MKKQLVLAAALVTGIAVTNSLYAISSERAMTAKIPFAFTAGRAELPAGEYSVKGTGVQHVVAFQDVNTYKRAMIMHNAVTKLGRQGGPVLVFHKYGDRYFLSEIWDGSTTGAQLSPTAAERELVARGASYVVAEVRLELAGRPASAD